MAYDNFPQNTLFIDLLLSSIVLFKSFIITFFHRMYPHSCYWNSKSVHTTVYGWVEGKKQN